MNFEPILLTDKSRLKEIYDLRVTAWEHSDKGAVINHQLFPEGWYDELDSEANHWIITNEEDKIIASARLNIFTNLEAFPYRSSLRNIKLVHKTPLGFYGRLVVHPQYHGLDLSVKLVTARINYCEMKRIPLLEALVTRERIKNILLKLDFKIIDQIEVNYHALTPPHLVNVFAKEYHYDENRNTYSKLISNNMDI